MSLHQQLTSAGLIDDFGSPVQIGDQWTQDELEIGYSWAPHSVNFGGNLDVSPPISAATNPQISSRGGPAFLRHPPAPFGKIILGDSDATRHAGPSHRLLQAQKAQLVLPLDTSWLGVGHIDEFLSFVTAPTTSPPGNVGRKGWVA